MIYFEQQPFFFLVSQITNIVKSIFHSPTNYVGTGPHITATLKLVWFTPLILGLCISLSAGIPIVGALLGKYHEADPLTRPTSIHSDFLQLCLAAKLLSPALKYLDCDVTTLSKEEVIPGLFMICCGVTVCQL